MLTWSEKGQIDKNSSRVRDVRCGSIGVEGCDFAVDNGDDVCMGSAYLHGNGRERNAKVLLIMVQWQMLVPQATEPRFGLSERKFGFMWTCESPHVTRSSFRQSKAVNHWP